MPTASNLVPTPRSRRNSPPLEDGYCVEFVSALSSGGARLPVEVAHGHHRADHAPDQHDGEVGPLHSGCADRVEEGIDRVQEVTDRKEVGDAGRPSSRC